MVRFSAELFDSIGFIALMIVIGSTGFYLGIDIPQPPSAQLAGPAKGNLVELLGAQGTFLAAISTLISVWAIVFDEIPSRIWEFAIGSWWVLGVVMQIGAGLTGRLRLARRAAT